MQTRPTYWLSALLAEQSHIESLWDSTQLGCSPAELCYNIELERQMTFAEHDGCPEMNLWTDGFSQI